MLHITCDDCGKQIRCGQDHFVLKIEVFAAHDAGDITDADLEEDHMEAVSELLREMEESEETGHLESASKHIRYDLCPDCRRRFLRDPLSKDAIQKFDFSKN